MDRRIVTWVATGAVVLGIGAAGVGAVVVNSNAAAKNGAPVAAAMTTQSTSATTSTLMDSPAQGGVLGSRMIESDEGHAQMAGTTGSAQSGAARNGGSALEYDAAAS